MSVNQLVTKIETFHQKQFALCTQLEAVADGLPHNIDRQTCLMLARDIYPAIKAAHEFEEHELFPYLKNHARHTKLDERLERLRFEHWEDEAYAEEISEVLSTIGRDGESKDAEKVSWMLRGFFDGLRRHIAYEADHLLPMLIKQPVEPSADSP